MTQEPEPSPEEVEHEIANLKDEGGDEDEVEDEVPAEEADEPE